jgi:Na+/melibiose symporter-like transporter
MLFHIKLFFGPIAGFINLAGVIIFCFFHYDRKEHESIQAELAGRKESLVADIARSNMKERKS